MYTVDNEDNQTLFVADENPAGVTMSINDNGKVCSFNMPRVPMIEVLEYLLTKIKART